MLLGWWQGPGDKWYSPSNASHDWRPDFPDRVPLLGDYNTQSTMDAEIAAAASHGLDFFQVRDPDLAETSRLLEQKRLHLVYG